MRLTELIRRLCLSKLAIISLVSMVAFGSIGIAYACYTYQPPSTCPSFIGISWVVSNDDGSRTNEGVYKPIDRGDDGGGTQYDYWGTKSSNDPYAPQDPGKDCPRYTKDVAQTLAVLKSRQSCGSGLYDSFEVTISNAYPYYYPTVFFGLRNCGCIPAKITAINIDEDPTTPALDDIPELYTMVNTISVGQVLNPCQEVVGRLFIRVNQVALQNHTYHILVTISATAQEAGGTIGFWKNWRNRYTSTQMQTLLTQAISAIPAVPPETHGIVASKWLAGITTVAQMDNLFANYSASATNKLKAQLLCTRLNVVANTLNMYGTHNISGFSYGFFITPPDPTSVPLYQIINAIEARYGPSNSNTQLDTMQSILNAINQEPPVI